MKTFLFAAFSIFFFLLQIAFESKAGPIIYANLPWEAKNPNADQWTEFLSKSLETTGKELLQVSVTDGKKYCKNFDKLNQEQRKVFYLNLISKMTEFESQFKPDAEFKECSFWYCPYGGGCSYKWKLGFCMRGGHKLDNGIVISRGLLQMSIASAQDLGCPIEVPNDLFKPILNLDCGVRALNKFIGQDKRIAGKDSQWRGGARYWAVLRDSGSNKKAHDAIAAWTNNLSFCKN